jgi:hypothetical protein
MRRFSLRLLAVLSFVFLSFVAGICVVKAQCDTFHGCCQASCMSDEGQCPADQFCDTEECTINENGSDCSDPGVTKTCVVGSQECVLSFCPDAFSDNCPDFNN